jgi:oxygen-independent coproporphyrinogen-3 oxidase
LLSPTLLRQILNTIHQYYDVEADAEVTLEMNPDDWPLSNFPHRGEASITSEDKNESIGLAALPTTDGAERGSVNRVSLGIQSFDDALLRLVRRRHDSATAIRAIKALQAVGVDNISIDLIYGLPTSDAEQWNRNLDIFFELSLPHLSAYALTLEHNAILTKQIELGKVQPINEEDALRDYEILCRRAAQNGYLHYEISNFCQRGMHSKHNSSYWFGTPYAGFGPSAHSYDGSSRQWNVANVEKYCSFSSLDEKEQISPEQHYNEYVMLRLRTHWGIDLKYMKREMGERFSTYCEQHAQPLIAQGRLSQTREFLYLTDAQMLFADGVAEELFWE